MGKGVLPSNMARETELPGKPDALESRAISHSVLSSSSVSSTSASDAEDMEEDDGSDATSSVMECGSLPSTAQGSFHGPETDRCNVVPWNS